MNIRVTTQSLAPGVIIPMLVSPNVSPKSFCRPIRNQAKRLARIPGVSGIAVNISEYERSALTSAEQMSVIRETRKGLFDNQVLWAGVGCLSEMAIEEAARVKRAGADTVIAALPKEAVSANLSILNNWLAKLAYFANQLTLPTIISVDERCSQTSFWSDHIADLARFSDRIVGVVLRYNNNVMYYDRSYYRLKTIDRPLSVVTSSDAALFHNLNTGSDGTLCDLAYIAPHEVCTLFAASQVGDFFEAQAIHNKLAPLTNLLNVDSVKAKEAMLRLVAHERGLLALPWDREEPWQLTRAMMHRVQKTLDDIQLKPISWT